MSEAFKQGGEQDLQRTYNGKTSATFVSAFTDAASFHLGLVTSFAGLAVWEAKAGGGLYNVKNSIKSILSGNRPLDISGDIWGNNPNNVKSIDAGYNLANSLKGVSGFLGDQVTLNIYYPNMTSASLRQHGTATVANGTTEFPSLAAMPAANPPPPNSFTVDGSVDLSRTDIRNCSTHPASGNALIWNNFLAVSENGANPSS